MLCAELVDAEQAAARVGKMGGNPADGLAAVRALLAANTPRARAKAQCVAQRHVGSLLPHDALVAEFSRDGVPKDGLIRFLGSQMVARADEPPPPPADLLGGDPDPAAPAGGSPVQPITLAYMRAVRDEGRYDELERVTLDPKANYDGRAALAMLNETTAAAATATATAKTDADASGGGGGGGGGGKGYNPRPLINICDRHGLLDELTRELYGRRMLGHLKLYLQLVNPANTPPVMSVLLDLGVEHGTLARVAELLPKLDAAALSSQQRVGDATRSLCARLVAAFEERKPSQLALLQPWLEAHEAAAEGTPDAEVIAAALQRIEKAAKAWW